jgi:Tfp pilus assembly protein PilV
VTLVEVLIASVVLLVVMIPMGILLTSVASASASARQREAALQLADSWVEILANSQPPTGANGAVGQVTVTPPVAPAGTQAPSSTLAGTTYTVSASYSLNLVNDVNGKQSDLCSAGEPPSPSHPGVIQVKVTVYWDGGGQQLSVTTEINYPKPGLQTEGFLAVNVGNDGENDVNGNIPENRLLALPVTITQLSGTPSLAPFTVAPDANGCIFVQVPVGSYDVSVAQPTEGTPAGFSNYSGTPPFVTTTGSTTDQSLNQQVTVTAETVVNLGYFDEGITTGIGYGGASAVDGGVDCPGGAVIQCITFGDGTNGATAAWGGASSPWVSTNLAAGTQINQIDCTTAVNAYCVGVGYGPAGGLIDSTPTDLNSLRSDTVPNGVTDLSQVTCLSNNGCYAMGLAAGGPVLLAGRVGPGTDTWAVVAHPGVTFSSLNSIACPTTTTCEVSYTGPGAAPGVLRLDGDPALLGINPLWGPTVTSDVLPSAVQSIGTIVCPSTTTCEATATGDQASPSDATVVTVSVGAFGPDSWAPESTFPTGATSVAGLSCAGTTCVAIGTATGSPAVWTGAIGGGTNSWSQSNTFPTNLQALSSVACGLPATTDSADCVVAGTSTSQSASGALLDGSLTGGSWAWNPVSIPQSDAVQYYLGVACESPATTVNATCAAVGATPNGPAVLTTGTGPAGNWSDQTPSTLTGLVVTGIPLETAAAGTSSWSTQVQQGGPSNATTLANAQGTTILYPLAGGYSIAASDCPAVPAQFVNSVANLVAPPGGVADVTVPLQLLPLELVNGSGNPVTGVTVTLTSTSCPGSDSYNLQPTDATGVTMDSVPYGSYSYTVTKGSTAVAHTNITITVGPNSIQVTNSAGSSPTTVTDYLPGTAQVPG